MGIDVGGSGFRIGVFDTMSGELIGPLHQHRHGVSTGPTDVLDAICEAIERLQWEGPIGLGFPGAVEANRPITAPNLGEEWVDVDVSKHLMAFHGGRFVMLNDADAVALGEAQHGVGHGGAACVLTLTIGTGLGTSVHRDGSLVPNLEYGRLPHPTRGGCLEEHLSGRARTQENLSLEAWAMRFQEGLTHLEHRLQPDRIILYGGLMEHWDEIRPLLSAKAELVAATLRETAGPLGAAMAAHDL
ncbi:MAG TPA: ROK family protein [Candidatus Poseidoniales archaeon]|nr:MAG TPA: ROK family protein [Candidatus Poseidoniales archaeon]HII20950.1 ROK family protein [Poseidonia sp.]